MATERGKMRKVAGNQRNGESLRKQTAARVLINEVFSPCSPTRHQRRHEVDGGKQDSAVREKGQRNRKTCSELGVDLQYMGVVSFKDNFSNEIADK